MKQIRALCDVWIDKLETDKKMILMVYNQNPQIVSNIIYLQKDDWLQFNHIAEGDDPYERLVKDYPEYFVMD